MCAEGLTLYLLTWRIWWAPKNASKLQMGFNSAFTGLIRRSIHCHVTTLWNHSRNTTCTDLHIKPSVHSPSNYFVHKTSSPSTYTNTDGYTVSYYILCSFLQWLYPTWWWPKIVLAETCSWNVMYNWQYSCAVTVMSMHNCFLTLGTTVRAAADSWVLSCDLWPISCSGRKPVSSISVSVTLH